MRIKTNARHYADSLSGDGALAFAVPMTTMNLSTGFT
jgi:hypothetical protein